MIYGNLESPISMNSIFKYKASSMQVLQLAELENEHLGHANLGFLSSSHGFMPKDQPLTELPPAFSL